MNNLIYWEEFARPLLTPQVSAGKEFFNSHSGEYKCSDERVKSIFSGRGMSAVLSDGNEILFPHEIEQKIIVILKDGTQKAFRGNDESLNQQVKEYLNSF